MVEFIRRACITDITNNNEYMSKVLLPIAFGLMSWFVSLGQSNNPIDDECRKTENLILKIAAAKVKFEESQEGEEGKQKKYKDIYASLVKEFKRSDKSATYGACLKALLEDPGSTKKKDVYFTYLPMTSSRIDPCNYLKYLAFVRIMLKNLNTPGDDGTVVCFAELIK
jgi:hypothetical protein